MFEQKKVQQFGNLYDFPIGKKICIPQSHHHAPYASIWK